MSFGRLLNNKLTWLAKSPGSSIAVEASIEYLASKSPCLEERGKSLDLQTEMEKLVFKNSGENGIFIARCMRDLISAMKDSNDSAFYCYRAIESLKNHCTIVNSLGAVSDAAQWDKFRESASCDRDILMDIKGKADPVRHGSPAGLTGQQREKLFMTTWEIVGNYLAGIQPAS
jgi:hypothetical protein